MRLPRRRNEVDLTEKLQALEEVVSTGRGRLPAELIAAVQAVLDRATERRRFTGKHTVVSLAGATGSGKSSLFNSVTGMDVSLVGVRRPTTAEPLACVWGTEGVVPLLEWLEVAPRRRVSRESVLDSGEADHLDGLVLLDLPDHDSTEADHRATVDRLVEMVDLFVWILDPQKYADAAIHERYLRPLSSHQAVTVVVLNQIDRLTDEQVTTCVEDLRRLLDEDGLENVPIVPVSAVTGEGVDQLVKLIRDVVTKRRAVEERIGADVRMSARLIAETAGAGQPGVIGSTERTRLIADLADASGVGVVAGAVGRSYQRRARAATGWPVTRWMTRLRADPLVRLGIATRRRDVDADFTRMTLPEPTPVQRARSDTAVRKLGDIAAGTLPGPWRDAIRGVAADSAGRLPAALDQAVASTDFQIARSPRWWTAANVVQWLALLTAAVGALWLLALAGASFLRLDLGDPAFAGLPVPTLLLAGGVVVGVVVAAGCFAAARYGSRRRAAAVGDALRGVVDRTASAVVWAPIEAELERYRSFQDALDRAGSR